jgi:hypothetical protein
MGKGAIGALAALLGLLAALVGSQAPEIRRYLKMRAM